MARTVSKQEAKADFDGVLGVLSSSNEAVVVEDGGEPVAIMITPEEYNRLRREDPWAVLDELRAANADQDPDEVYQLVTEVVEQVRQERYEQRQQAATGHR